MPYCLDYSKHNLLHFCFFLWDCCSLKKVSEDFNIHGNSNQIAVCSAYCVNSLWYQKCGTKSFD